MWKYKGVTTLCILVVLAAALVATARQLPTPEEATERMRLYRERTRGTVTLRQALLGVLRDRGVPGGLVMSLWCDEEERVPEAAAALSPETPLAGSLDLLVSAASQYEWRSEGGVVNLAPRGELPALLRVRVARFRAEGVRTPGEALEELLKTPEVREALARPEVGSRLFRGGLGFYDPPPDAEGRVKTFSVSLDGVTVREALNAVARAHGSALWTYRPLHCRGGNDFELDFEAW